MNTMTTNTAGPLQVTVHPLQEVDNGQFWSGDAPTFKDLLDTINPLQHIPIISSIYQYVTGDKPSSGSDVIGGALFGGGIGLLSAVFNEIVKMHTGSDASTSMLALATGESTLPPAGEGNTPNAPSQVNKAAYNAYRQMQSLVA